MARKIFEVLGIFLLVIFTACNKDRSEPTFPGNNPGAPPTAGPGERNVYVVCEGSFGNGNASLYMQNLETGTNYENVYHTLNGYLLGDVFQSMTRAGDRLLLAINNSDKVIALDAKTREEVGMLTIPKPRYILPVHENKAYVSTLYSNKVYVIDPARMRIDKIIELPAQNPEGMALAGSKLYVCPWDTASNKVYTIDISSDEVIDSFEVAGKAPQEVLIDRVGAIWVLAGNVAKGVNATLTRLAPNVTIVMQSYDFGPLKDPIRPVFNTGKDRLYFIGVAYNGTDYYNGIFSMGIDDVNLPTSPIIPASKNQYFWALGIDPATDEIYVGDPKGFIQKGSVSVYSPTAELKKTFNVGVGPGHFYFDE